MDLNTFTNTLLLLQSSDNDVRKQAEEQYEKLQAAEKVAALLEVFIANESAEVKELTLVLLRRVFARDWSDVWNAFSEENKQLTKQKLLEFVLHDANVISIKIKKKLADVIAEIASNLLDTDTGDQTWTDVLKLIEHCATSSDFAENYIGLLIISNTPTILGNATKAYTTKLKALFSKCLASNEAEIRSTAVRAVVNFVIDNDEEDRLVKEIGTLVPLLVQACSCHAQDDDTDGPFGSLAELTAHVPKLITPHLTSVLNLCLSVAGEKQNPDSVRQCALEVITTYAETAPKSLKKHAHTSIASIIELCLVFMGELDDDSLEDWLSGADEDDYEEAAGIGESAIDRMACTLHGKAFLPVFLQIIERYMGSHDWKLRHASLRAFSAIGEGCQRAMEPQIEHYVNHIVKFTNDEHPRVCYAACNALGQMATDFNPTFQKRCHKEVIEALITCMRKSTCPRVAAHACSALINFCEDCPKLVIFPYIPHLLDNLEAVLGENLGKMEDKKYRNVVETAVSAIASVAEAADDLFKSYYERLMNMLTHILENSNVDELKELRGKTIECISLIGSAVGKELFREHALKILHLLSPSMMAMEIDDPQYSYMMLKEDFAPFLPVVMDPLLRAAEHSPQISLFGDDDEENDDEEIDEVEKPAKGEIAIRTSGLEEKSTACDMIVGFAREMKGAFMPWVPRVAEVCLKNMTFILDDNVQQSSAETLSYLLICVQEKGLPAMRQLWTAFLPALSEAINGAEIEGANFLTNLAECIDVMTGEGINIDEFKIIVQLVETQIETYIKRRTARIAEEEEEEIEDQEELSEELQWECDNIGGISSVVHSLMKATNGALFETLSSIFKTSVDFTQSPTYYFERQYGMCMLDDIIEYGQQYVFQHLPFLPIMIKLLQDDYPEVRQAAAYGFGVMAVRSHEIPQYKNDVLQALEPMSQMIQRSDAKGTEESTIATENAISAFAKVLMNVQIDETVFGKCVEMFLSWLPTHIDRVESPFIYGCLTQLFASQNSALLGPNGAHLPRILNIALCALRDEAFEDDDEGNSTKAAVVNMINTMRSNEQLFPEVVQKAQLDESLIAVLQS